LKLSVRHLFNLALVAVLLAFVTVAAGYNPQARLMPLIIGIPVLALAVWQTVSDLILGARGAAAGAAAGERLSGSPREVATPPRVPGREIGVFLWTLLLFLLLYLFGFVATTFLYTFLSLKIRSRLNWPLSLGVAAAALAFLYGVMVYALKVQLYPGIVTLALRRMFYGY